MLPSLYIRGFRCFRELTIPRLGRVNLVVGKNNVGKSMLLDALLLHAAHELALFELQEMLDRRGEVVRSRPSHVPAQRLVDWTRAFHEGVVEPNGKAEFVIGPRREIESETLHITSDRNSIKSRPRGGTIVRNQRLPAPTPKGRDELSWQMIPASALPVEKLSLLWDEIVLTELEDVCLRALRIIEPGILRVALVDVPGLDGRVERSPHVLRAGRAMPEPLRSLGEGMHRLFEVTLGMVNVRGGWLLIDEVENGLHYSVHEELWRHVFRIASDLDVQVFALLVEGRDDREVIYQLCNRCGIDNRSHFEVVAYEGFDALRAGFEIELKTDRETIGILADADADMAERAGDAARAGHEAPLPGRGSCARRAPSRLAPGAPRDSGGASPGHDRRIAGPQRSPGTEGAEAAAGSEGCFDPRATGEHGRNIPRCARAAAALVVHPPITQNFYQDRLRHHGASPAGSLATTAGAGAEIIVCDGPCAGAAVVLPSRLS